LDISGENDQKQSSLTIQKPSASATVAVGKPASNEDSLEVEMAELGAGDDEASAGDSQQLSRAPSAGPDPSPTAALLTQSSSLALKDADDSEDT